MDRRSLKSFLFKTINQLLNTNLQKLVVWLSMKPEQIQLKFEIIDSLKINFNILSNEPDRFIKSS